MIAVVKKNFFMCFIFILFVCSDGILFLREALSVSADCCGSANTGLLFFRRVLNSYAQSYAKDSIIILSTRDYIAQRPLPYRDEGPFRSGTHLSSGWTIRAFFRKTAGKNHAFADTGFYVNFALILSE
jgi:hypothetical protein